MADREPMTLMTVSGHLTFLSAAGTERTAHDFECHEKNLQERE